MKLQLCTLLLSLLVLTAAAPVPIKRDDCEHSDHPPLKRGAVSDTLLNADPTKKATPGNHDKFYRIQVTDYEPNSNDY